MLLPHPRLALFGAMHYFHNCAKYEKELHEGVASFVVVFDNDAKFHHHNIDGVPIAPPQCYADYDFDYILIDSNHYGDICSQLMALGVHGSKILPDVRSQSFSDMRLLEFLESGGKTDDRQSFVCNFGNYTAADLEAVSGQRKVSLDAEVSILGMGSRFRESGFARIPESIDTHPGPRCLERISVGGKEGHTQRPK